MKKRMVVPIALAAVIVVGLDSDGRLVEMQSLGEWATATPMPRARKEISNATVSLNGKIYVVGGISQDGMMRDILEVYDPATDTWTSARPMPTRVWRTSAAAADGKLYVFGGYRSTRGFPFGPTNRVLAYDPDADQWTEKAPMPTARGTSVSVEVEGRIHVLGGAASTALNAHEVYDPAADMWATAAPLPTPRSGLTATVIEGQIYVAGGYIFSGGVVPQSVLQVYHPVTGMWSRLQSMPLGRVGLAAATMRGKMYVFGGAASAAVPSRTLEYDPVSDSWRQLADMPDAVSFMGVAAIDELIHVIGGGAVNLNRFDGLDVNRVFVPPMG